ncbi:CPBP family intramembrane glutamic endopeptidase [Bacillus sp. 2205SS5-2]|uniref:CPBP family intramembrane glutamic endopeptidase n=1 Tax=Bacillus sp. 2205SS5-2 TaxID=3109031 RepID=UPI00300679DC
MKNSNRQAELVKQLSDKELTIHLLITQAIMLGLSFLLFLLFRKKWHEYVELVSWNVEYVAIGVAGGFLVVLLDLFLMNLLPSHYYDDGGINERIFSTRSYPYIAFLALLIAFCEEWLFRGVLQFNIGWFWASLIFAVIHIRYWRSGFLILNVTLLSFLIGWIFHVTGSLLVTIVMHFLIDFLLGIHIRRNAIRQKINR